MPLRRTLLAMLALVAAATTACTGDAPDAQLPEGAALVRDASTATRDITSTHFTIEVNGTIPGLAVRGLDGDLTREGEAKGSGTIEQSGQLVEIEFVLKGNTLYLKGPTGGYQQIPVALSSSVYDPSAVLDPERGVSKLLSSLRDPVTEATEEIGGVQTYKVTGTLPKDVLAGLLPGIDSDAEVSFWLRKDERHLPVKATAAFPNDATVDVTLSDVDKPVTVSPPA
ncbi:lipoprotein LprG [Saccharomonospora amisosensis]|uniref:Lipoprotein LprG n=1 Tax=Saccharomonospora amisosensis TaxID=1128677 RepID=A0A7X5ZSM4_9PSEU|nr:LppX_LprAFG lipoprotein [Saccharomonospora amisosensis]NIJ14063.1 lipoprotein LprG [Saccharomonospora amisosensis]